jgi:hypothetical protein
VLVEHGEGRDRAFADGVVRMRWSQSRDPALRADLERLLHELRAASRKAHAAMRADIASGALQGQALRERFERISALERDHLVEEVLGVAYPPLDEASLEPELIAYMPSGYDEILHALDVTGLSAGDRLLDIGSGTGKVVLLAALLRGATSAGVERDAALVDVARRAAAELGVRGVGFEHGDARALGVAPADVVFMYLPFTGRTLDTVMARILASRSRWICAGALEPERRRGFEPVGPARSWLHVYERAGV